MATIAENLQTIIDIKADIKTAIENKGVTVGDAGFGEYASKIENINKLNIGNNVKLAYSNFSEVPSYCDFSNVVDMDHMFAYCRNLTTIPELSTSNVTTMRDTFLYCTKLTYVTLFDTSNVILMNSMFYNCSSLTSLPLFDTSKVTYMGSMCQSCSSLTSIPQFNTSRVYDMDHLCWNCTSLATIPELDASSITYPMSSIISGCNNLSYIGGFKDLGKNFDNYASNFGFSLTIPNSSNLTHESCMNIINKVYDLNLTNYSKGATIKFGATPYALLTSDDIAIATAKGWIIESA